MLLFFFYHLLYSRNKQSFPHQPCVSSPPLSIKDNKRSPSCHVNPEVIIAESFIDQYAGADTGDWTVKQTRPYTKLQITAGKQILQSVYHKLIVAIETPGIRRHPETVPPSEFHTDLHLSLFFVVFFFSPRFLCICWAALFNPGRTEGPQLCPVRTDCLADIHFHVNHYRLFMFHCMTEALLYVENVHKHLAIAVESRNIWKVVLSLGPFVSVSLSCKYLEA